MMAVVPAQSLRVSEIKDPTVLFERYSTEEIRAIERKVRGEIEQKKEELRQMVGERYRDLIDAADTIGEMRQCSESVVKSIQNMYSYCNKLKQPKTSPQINNKEEVRLSPLILKPIFFMFSVVIISLAKSAYPIFPQDQTASGHFGRPADSNCYLLFCVCML